MKKSIRHQAVDILSQISTSQSFAGELLDASLEANALSGTPDGRLLTHIVYGVLRFQGHLDWIISNLYRGNFAGMDESIKNVLRVGLYQLKFSDRLPAFAVVDEAVKSAKIIAPAQSGLTNAILRNYLRQGDKISFPSWKKQPVEHIAALHSHPLWLVKTWLNIFGKEDTLALCKANNEMPPTTIRINKLKTSQEELEQKLKAEGFSYTITNFSPDGLVLTDSTGPVQKTDLFREGLLRMQDEGAQLVSYLINPKNNENILDVCAGTGGKTTHLAAILKNDGHILAVDRHEGKLAELTKEIGRLGINNIETKQVDLGIMLPAELKEKFDQVLVDAPCSGTGTLRRNPEIKWRTQAIDLSGFAVNQKTILQNAAPAVKKGGRLIYCTCSLLPAENEDVIRQFLTNNPQFALGPIPEAIKKPLIDKNGFFRTYPHIHNTDGFFGAILQRQCGC
jgi:16S rRNA (cytosine967-C5)-methyltransferase